MNMYEYLEQSPLAWAMQSLQQVEDEQLLQAVTALMPDDDSTHTDKDGNVVAVYYDNDWSVYKHDTLPARFARTNEDLDAGMPKLKGGTRMGSTLMWNSFTDFDQTRQPIGRINFTSFEARDFINTTIAEFRGMIKGDTERAINARFYYALNAGNGGKYDFKTRGGPNTQNANTGEGAQILIHKFRGSQLSHGLYISARDAGNFMAGTIARLTGQQKVEYMIIAGAFNLANNNKWKMWLFFQQAQQIGAPGYGEHPGSNFFQRAGYHDIRTWSGYTKNYNLFWGAK